MWAASQRLIMSQRGPRRLKSPRSVRPPGAAGGEPAAHQLGAAGEAVWTAPARAAEPGPVTAPAPGLFAGLASGVIPEPRNGAEMTGGIAVIESMLAEAEARRGFDEEETW